MQLVTAILIQHGFGHMKKQREKLQGAGHLNLSTLTQSIDKMASSSLHQVQLIIGG
jgi:hypothetical protein